MFAYHCLLPIYIFPSIIAQPYPNLCISTEQYCSISSTQIADMELELGLKITKTIDGSQSTDFRITTDRTGPIFLSRETESLFILTAHLKGYKRANVKIDINEDGTLIAIRGEKPVQEMVMRGWLMFKKEPEIKGFKKIFKIPRGVILDRIKAKYNEEESTLTIHMPKLEKGVTGDKVEEVNSEPEDVSEASEDVKEVDQVKETEHEPKEDEKEEVKEVCEVNQGGMTAENKSPFDEIGSSKNENEELSTNGKGKELAKEEEIEDKAECSHRREEEELRQREESQQNDHDDQGAEEKHDVPEKNVKRTSNLFAPCFFMGSAFFASLVVLVISLVRSKR